MSRPTLIGDNGEVLDVAEVTSMGGTPAVEPQEEWEAPPDMSPAEESLRLAAEKLGEAASLLADVAISRVDGTECMNKETKVNIITVMSNAVFDRYELEDYADLIAKAAKESA